MGPEVYDSIDLLAIVDLETIEGHYSTQVRGVQVTTSIHRRILRDPALKRAQGDLNLTSTWTSKVLQSMAFSQTTGSRVTCIGRRSRRSP